MGIYSNLENKYYELVESLGLLSIIQRIDKIIPSFPLILFILLILLCSLIYILIPKSLNVSFEVYYDDKLYNYPLELSLTQGSNTIKKTSDNGRFIANVKKGNLIVKVDKFDYLATINIKSNIHRLFIPKNQVLIEGSDLEKIKTMIMLKDAQGRVYSDLVNLNVICSDDSLNFSVVNGYLNFDRECEMISIRGEIDGYMPINSNCNTSRCDVILQRTNTSSNSELESITSKNDISIYVKGFDDLAISNANVKIALKDLPTLIIDSKTTNSFGSVIFENLSLDKYVVFVRDEIKGSISKDINLVSGPTHVEVIMFDRPSIGSFKFNINSSDQGLCMGKLFILDSNRAIIDQIDTNCNSSVNVPVYEIGDYYFSYSLNLDYQDKYFPVSETKVVFGSGTQDVDVVVRKINYTDATKVRLKVLDEKNNPISNVRVYVENPQGYLQTEYESKLSDLNGLVEFTLDVGDYVFKTTNFTCSNGSISYSAINRPSANSFFTEDLEIFLRLGYAKINFKILDDFLEPINFSAKLYKNNQFLGIFQNPNSIDVNACNYYSVVIEANEKLSYMSQKSFLKDRDEFDISYNMYPINSYNQNTSQVNFLGIYNDFKLQNRTEKIESSKTYFYAFDILIPPNAISPNLDKYLHFFVGENRNQDYINSSNTFIKAVYGSDTSYLFSDFNKDNLLYSTDVRAKYGYLKTNISMPISYRVILDVRVKPNLNLRDNILLSYSLSDTNSMPNNFNTIVNHLGITYLCQRDICADILIDGFSKDLGKPILVQENFKMDLNLNFGSTINDSNFVYYMDDRVVQNIDSLNSLNKTYFEISNLNISKSNFANSVNLFTENNSLFGPIIYRNDQNNYSNNSVLNIRQDTKFISNENRSIFFTQFFYNDTSKSSSFIFTPNLNKEIFANQITKSLVLNQSNKLDFEIYGGVVEELNSRVEFLDIDYKLFQKEGLNYVFKSSGNIIKVDDVFSLDINILEDLRIVFFKDDYIPKTIDLNYSEKLFEVGTNNIQISVPSLNPIQRSELVVENLTNFEFDIVDFAYVVNSQNLLNNAIDFEKLKNYFLNRKILPSQKKLDILYEYDRDNLINFNSLGILDTSLSLIVNLNDINYDLEIPLKFDFKFSNAPMQESCIRYELLNMNESPINSISIISDAQKFKFRVYNNCVRDDGSKYFFDEVELKIESKGSIPINFTFESTKFSQKEIKQISSSGSINLENVKGNLSPNYEEYIVEMKINGLYDENNENNIKFYNSSNNVEFNLIPKYRVNNDLRSVSITKKNLEVFYKSLNECIDFSLDEDLVVQRFNEFTGNYVLPSTLKSAQDLYFRKYNNSKDYDKSFVRFAYEKVLNKYMGLFETNEYVIDKLPIKVVNNCGINLNLGVYNLNGKIDFSNRVNLNLDYDIIELERPSISGAYILQLKEVDRNLVIKELYINVQTSESNDKFTTDPFTTSKNSPIYKNEFYNKIDFFEKDLQGFDFWRFSGRDNDTISETHKYGNPWGVDSDIRGNAAQTHHFRKIYLPTFLDNVMTSTNKTQYVLDKKIEGNISFCGKDMYIIGAQMKRGTGCNSSWPSSFGELRKFYYSKYEGEFKSIGNSCAYEGNDDKRFYYLFNKSNSDCLNNECLFNFSSSYSSNVFNDRFWFLFEKNKVESNSCQGNLLGSLSSYTYFESNNLNISEDSYKKSISSKENFSFKGNNDSFYNSLKQEVYRENFSENYVVVFGIDQIGGEKGDLKSSLMLYCPKGYGIVLAKYFTQTDGFVNNLSYIDSIDLVNNFYKIEHNSSFNDRYGLSVVYGYSVCIKDINPIRKPTTNQTYDVKFTEKVSNITKPILSINSCSAGGITKFDTQIDYSNDVNCEEDMCDLYSFTNYLDKELSNVQEFTSSVYLMHGVYSKDVILSIKDSEFLSKIKEFDILNEKLESVGYLNPGKYFVRYQDDKVYLFRQNLLGINLPMYYMPKNYSNNTTPYTTSVSPRFSIDNTNNFQSDSSYVSNFALESISKSNLPVVMEVVFTQTDVVQGTIKFNEDSCYESIKINNLSKVNKDLTKYSYYNIFIKEGSRVYTHNNYVDLNISNNTLVNLIRKNSNTFEIYFFGVKKSCENGKINNLNDIVTEIENGSICYLNENDKHIFYYDVERVILSAQN